MPRQDDASFSFLTNAFKHTATSEWENRHLENSEY
jgi:hypothetical protein